MKVFNIAVQCKWFDEQDNVIDSRTKNYKVKANDDFDAIGKAETQAANDNSFKHGKPDEVTAFETAYS